MWRGLEANGSERGSQPVTPSRCGSERLSGRFYVGCCLMCGERLTGNLEPLSRDSIMGREAVSEECGKVHEGVEREQL